MVVRQMGWWTWGAPARSLTRHLHELRHRRLVLERVVERLAINEDGQVVGADLWHGRGAVPQQSDAARQVLARRQTQGIPLWRA